MCQRKIYVVNEIYLGARPVAIEAYSLPKGEVLEFTSKQLISMIREGKDEVYGLQLSEDGNSLEFDKSFFTTNMMKKIHTGILKMAVETENLVPVFYIVIGTHEENGNTVYEMISSRYERLTVSEEKLKLLFEMGFISGGCKMEEEKIIVAPMKEEVKKVSSEEPKKTTKETNKK